MKAAVWIQRDGTPIPVTHMSDKHISCTIAMLSRGKNLGKPKSLRWIETLRIEQLRRSIEKGSL